MTDGYVVAPLVGGVVLEGALRQVCIKVLGLDCGSSCPGSCSEGGTSCSNPEAILTSLSCVKMARHLVQNDTVGI